MPSFSYKGYDFEVDHTPSEEEFAQMSAHVDSLPPKTAPQPSPSLMPEDTAAKAGAGLRGIGEAGVGMLAGMPAMIGSGLYGLSTLASGQGYEQATKNIEDFQKSNFGAGAYQAPSEEGRIATEKLGEAFALPGQLAGKAGALVGPKTEFAAQTLTDMAMNFLPLHGAKKIATPRAIEALVKPTEAPRTGVKSLTEALIKEEPVAPTGEALVDTRSSLDKSKIAYEQALREQELQRQSAFNRPEQLGNMEVDTPMGRMARDLGAEPGVIEKPLGRMAEDLTNPPKDVIPQANAETAARQAATSADAAMAERQVAMEREVAQRTSLEQGAAERARQETAPVYSAEHMAETERVQRMADVEFEKHLSNLETQRKRADIQAEQAKGAEAVAKAKEAQRVLEDRQKAVEQEVARRGTLDFNAAERGRREAGTIPIDAEKHPFVAAAEARVTKAEQLLLKLTVAAEEGHAGTATRLIRAKADLAHLESLAEKARTNVGKERVSPLGPKNRSAPKGKQGGKVLVDWGTRKKLEGFSGIPGVKGTLRDIGHSMIKSPQEAIELAGRFGDVAQNKLQQGINALTKGGTYLKGKVDNPVVHYVVDRFLTAEGKARGEINTKLNGEYLATLRELSKDEYQDAFTLLNAADLTQKTITPEMMRQHGLSANLQDFISTHQNLMGDVLGKINAAREAVGKKAISAREAYSAMSMSGDYRKAAFKTIDGVKTIVGVISANRKVGRLGWTLEKIEKHMKEKDPTLEFVAPKGYDKDGTPKRSASSDKGTPHEAFQDALAVLGENNPHIAEFLKTLKEVAKDDPANYMGMQTHTMQKKGVWGMEGRKPWMNEKGNATAFFENQVKYMEGAYQWGHLAEAARDTNQVMRDPSVVSKHGNAIALSERYMQNALGLNPSSFGRAVSSMIDSFGHYSGIGPSNVKTALGTGKALANTMMLSLNPSFLAIQLIQGPAALPAMTALLRGRGLAPKASMLTGGLDHFVESGATLLKGMRNESSLSAVDRGAVEYARKNHIYASDMVEHTNQTTKGGTYWMHKATQSPAALIESGTRAQVYMTFTKMMHESGLKVSDGLYEQAHRLTDQTMNNYGALEKPAIYNALGPLGTMAYNLKSFGHNEISRWSMLAREISATGNPVPLLTQMATTIALAGVMGLPFYSQWESLYDFITAKMGTPRSLSLDVINTSEKMAKDMGADSDKFKFAMSHGGAAMMGADISKRIGLGDVLASKGSDIAFAGGGKLVDMAGSAVGMALRPDEAHAKAAAMAWAPPIVGSILKEKWYTDENHSFSMNPDKPRQVTADLTQRDKTLKKMGITGINESVQKEREFRLGELDKAYQSKRDTAMNGMTFQMGAGKPPSAENIAKYIEEGQGDPATLEAALNSALMKLKISPNQRAILAQAASQNLTQVMSLQRRMENQ